MIVRCLCSGVQQHGGHHRPDHPRQQGEEAEEDLRDSEVYVRLRPVSDVWHWQLAICNWWKQQVDKHTKHFDFFFFCSLKLFKLVLTVDYQKFSKMASYVMIVKHRLHVWCTASTSSTVYLRCISAYLGMYDLPPFDPHFDPLVHNKYLARWAAAGSETGKRRQ